MFKAVAVLFLLALAGCSDIPRHPDTSPCSGGEASYECQIERYQNVDS